MAEPPAKLVRAFVGVGLPDPHRERLSGYLEVCRAAAPGLRWVNAESLHLTLRFLGNLEPGMLEALADALRAVRFEPFEVAVGGLGTFGRGSAVRVAWIGVTSGGAQLARLAGDVEERCQAFGFSAEERAYNPHLTLARTRDRRGTPLPDLPGPPSLAPWTVDRFRLYRSRLGPGGAVYSVLAEYPAG